MPKGEPSDQCEVCRKFVRHVESWQVDEYRMYLVCDACEFRLVAAVDREIAKIEEENL